ncbi:MAG: hypothetical protein WCO06_02580 [Candidatus Roizmanbacteria bacterium]
MKSFLSSLKKDYLITISLILITILSVFLNIYKKDISPPGFNADEASFAYNAYSILKTGRDEYGTFMPLRLKSFGDYKMPLYSYLSVPFIALFGLNETGARALNTFLACLFPLAVFALSYELFKNKYIGILSSLFTSTALGLHILGRHAHESYLATLLIIISSLFFIRYLKTYSYTTLAYFLISLLLSLFAYQSSRIYAFAFFILLVIHIVVTKKGKIGILFLILTISLFSISDIIYTPTRVSNLLFFNSAGFQMKIKEIRESGGSSIIYNKATVGIRTVLNETLKYYSPQFLIINGDENTRFGYPEMSLISPLVYLFFFIGMYYIFKEKERWRYFLILFFITAPFSASLSWAGVSLSRSLFILVPLCIVSSYGVYFFLSGIPQLSLNRITLSKRKVMVISGILLISIEIFFLISSWTFYLFHYPTRSVTIRSWQTGYKQLAHYIKLNYSQYDTIYITKNYGMPYIFMLFYLQYPPDQYQKIAKLSIPDKYGFGYVEQYDKFVFSFPDIPKGNSMYVGFPGEDYSNRIEKYNTSQKKVIREGIDDIFWITDSRK